MGNSHTSTTSAVASSTIFRRAPTPPTATASLSLEEVTTAPTETTTTKRESQRTRNNNFGLGKRRFQKLMQSFPFPPTRITVGANRKQKKNAADEELQEGGATSEWTYSTEMHRILLDGEIHEGINEEATEKTKLLGNGNKNENTCGKSRSLLGGGGETGWRFWRRFMRLKKYRSRQQRQQYNSIQMTTTFSHQSSVVVADEYDEGGGDPLSSDDGAGDSGGGCLRPRKAKTMSSKTTEKTKKNFKKKLIRFFHLPGANGKTKRSPLRGNKSKNAASSVYGPELEKMRTETNARLCRLRASVDTLERKHMKVLDKLSQRCASDDKASSNHTGSILFSLTARQQNHSLDATTMETARLRSAILDEKLRTAADYLDQCQTLLTEYQRIANAQPAREDSMLRLMLRKRAGAEAGRGHWGDAFDAFCQLIVATDGRLNPVEATLLERIVHEKMTHTREFHRRIQAALSVAKDSAPFDDENNGNRCGDAKESVDVNNNSGAKLVSESSPVMRELWTSVREDLLTECSDCYAVVMSIQSSSEPSSQDGGDKRQRAKKNGRDFSSLVERKRQWMAVEVCALWLDVLCHHYRRRRRRHSQQQNQQHTEKEDATALQDEEGKLEEEAEEEEEEEVGEVLERLFDALQRHVQGTLEAIKNGRGKNELVNVGGGGERIVAGEDVQDDARWGRRELEGLAARLRQLTNVCPRLATTKRMQRLTTLVSGAVCSL